MRLRINHATTYHFDPPMRGVAQSLRLTPSLCESQQTISWEIDTGEAERGAGFRDGAGDWVETMTLMGPVKALTVEVRGEVETIDTGGILRGHRERVPPESYLRDSRFTRPDRAIRALAEATVAEIDPADILARAHALAAAIRDAIAYTPGETEHGTTAAEALALGHGVCQDHAHTLIAAATALDIPARYVTGYLFASLTKTAPTKPATPGPNFTCGILAGWASTPRTGSAPTPTTSESAPASTRRKRPRSGALPGAWAKNAWMSASPWIKCSSDAKSQFIKLVDFSASTEYATRYGCFGTEINSPEG